MRLVRSRNIKPAFFTNDDLVSLPPLTRIFFIGLWCFADREGRFEVRPVKMKGQILPLDNGDITVMLQELHRKNLIELYEVGGRRYGWIPTFKKHQHPHHTEAESVIPDISKGKVLTVNSPLDNGEYPSRILIPDSIKNILLSEVGAPRSEVGAQASSDVKSPKKEKAFCRNSDEFRLSEILFFLIKKRRPGFKSPDLQKWAEVVDRMIRIDKRSVAEIEDVIVWCQNDEFWQNNILSTEKLRKQYDQLAMKMESVEDDPYGELRKKYGRGEDGS
jgi:hypothetical protein